MTVVVDDGTKKNSVIFKTTRRPASADRTAGCQFQATANQWAERRLVMQW